YGATYLPRKFKIGLAIPPQNDIDVFAQDLALIAIVEHGELLGFNVGIGGGMGATHGDPATYPRLADVIGFVWPSQLIALAETVIAVQRDWGDREERKHARLKYTIDTHGLDAVKAEIEQRLGFALEPARAFRFDNNGDRYGWVEGHAGRWHLTLQVESGRLLDRGAHTWLSGMRELAGVHTGDIRLTCNQNLIIANVAAADRAAIDALVVRHGMDGYKRHSAIRQHAIACVALPTCGLAMAESERYLPTLLPKLEALLDRHGLLDTPILLRLSGCPNGCSRPYLGEIALVGRGPGRYDLRLGADFRGQRLNQVWRENVDEAAILAALARLFCSHHLRGASPPRCSRETAAGGHRPRRAGACGDQRHAGHAQRCAARGVGAGAPARRTRAVVQFRGAGRRVAASGQPPASGHPGDPDRYRLPVPRDLPFRRPTDGAARAQSQGLPVAAQPRADGGAARPVVAPGSEWHRPVQPRSQDRADAARAR